MRLLIYIKIKLGYYKLNIITLTYLGQRKQLLV